MNNRITEHLESDNPMTHNPFAALLAEMQKAEMKKNLGHDADVKSKIVSDGVLSSGTPKDALESFEGKSVRLQLNCYMFDPHENGITPSSLESLVREKVIPFLASLGIFNKIDGTCATSDNS